MDLSRLITDEAVYKEARQLADSKGKRKSFELNHRYIERRNNDFYDYLKNEANIAEFCESLHNYTLSNYTGFPLYKGLDAGGKRKYRPLLIPVHSDRLLFSIVNKILFPLLEPHLRQFHCLGIGLTENDQKIATGPVIAELVSLNISGYTHILKTDFKRFFCTIERKRLMNKAKPFIIAHPEGKMLYTLVYDSLHRKIDTNPIFKREFASWQLEHKGIAQGLSYSSLLASFYGTILDKAVEQIPEVQYKRYLDDMVILGKNAASIEDAYLKLKEVSRKIGLHLHDKGPVTDGKTFEIDCTKDSYIFLGVEIKDYSARIPDKAIIRFKQTIEQEIINSAILNKYNPEQIKEVFDNYTEGWKRAYKATVSSEHFKQILIELNEYLSIYLNKRNRHKKLDVMKFKL